MLADTIQYEFTVVDPEILEAPWTALSQGPKDANPLGLFDSKRRREYGGQQTGELELSRSPGVPGGVYMGVRRWCEASVRRSS